MIGIENIAFYIPSSRRNNFDLMEQFQIDDNFIKEKIGIEQVSIKDDNEEASDLCFKACQNLPFDTREEILNSIDCIVVVTQNPDSNIPHVSAKVHGLLELKETCACFDISLGCSGFEYGSAVKKIVLTKHYCLQPIRIQKSLIQMIRIQPYFLVMLQA